MPDRNATATKPFDAPPGDLPIARTAFFFDFDGTLVDIAEKPADVRLRSDVRSSLQTLLDGADGAVAVVSGRTIGDLKAHLTPLRPSLAGNHGAQWRMADGTSGGVFEASATLAPIARSVAAFVGAHSGLLCEQKPASVALHFRKRPDLEPACRKLADDLCDRYPGIRLLRGKMVVELKASARTKGDAVMQFMARGPFAGRLPVYVGDDVTDEDGFAAVALLGGLAVKIGSGPTIAHLRLEDTAGFWKWLERLARNR